MTRCTPPYTHEKPAPPYPGSGLLVYPASVSEQRTVWERVKTWDPAKVCAAVAGVALMIAIPTIIITRFLIPGLTE